MKAGKKLTLNKETLRVLKGSQLATVGGAGGTVTETIGITIELTHISINHCSEWLGCTGNGCGTSNTETNTFTWTVATSA
jgi:hypothetical protein